ncbi:MORC family CW-type zinc finger protein 3 isoform X2 [Pseudoliparis swirei]|uniref:MORC family CW-type zinc finger protein 3 isoform X2 n=1 Tax=Pseudoliparis swirei TaxID=2059687 RepID=UPI0024BD7013|nr:MORC family CW-type zinc finger protein 3 isoform X2 [Pseudoliparis swirei]
MRFHIGLSSVSSHLFNLPHDFLWRCASSCDCGYASARTRPVAAMARLSEHGIRLSSMSPSFLNSNSTSHTWAFSAVAELIDNASDPGVTAKQIWIDVVDEAGQLCLTFTDNGSGMTPNKLHKMLSFGFTEKGSGRASLQAIGVYGNGFKSGSMRLGRDALIFTKNGGCETVGMLSQTYLRNIKAQAVIIPIVPFNQQTKSLVVTEDSEASLAAILKHSIITSQEQIHAQFDSILSKKGTKIFIWNIRRAKDGKPEIDFETDVSDFRLPEIHEKELKKYLRTGGSPGARHDIPDIHKSLSDYLSILYLKPRTQIFLRGKKIVVKLVSKRLKLIEHDVYKPHFSKDKVKVTFGMNPKNKDHFGIMMYYRNRLIKAYEKVGCQLKASGQRAGVGVIGIIECNFLKPAHNKQDFEFTKEYRLTLGALGLKLNDYWKEVTEKKAREREFQAVERDEDADQQDSDEGPMWIQCEDCLKWRNVPVSHYNVAPESWTCSQNPNSNYRSCSSPEEAEDVEELLTPSYQKNHKKQEDRKSRKREKSMEVSESQDESQKHPPLSRSSSEPSWPTIRSDRSRTEEDTLGSDRTRTVHADAHVHDDAQTQSTVTAEVTHTQQSHGGRRRVIEGKTQVTHVEKESIDNRGEAKERDTDVQPVEREKEDTDAKSHKRKSRSLIDSVKKKPRLQKEQPDSENTAKEMNPEKPTDIPETVFSEKTRPGGSSRVEKQGDAAQRTPTNLSWNHSLPSTQTVMVSPLSRTEGPWSRMPPEGSGWEANVQKLAGLEKEAQRLRRLLNLEVTKTTQGTMTTADRSSEKSTAGPETRPASRAGREVGCQTDLSESCSSSSSLTSAPGLLGMVVLGHRAVCGLIGQPEQNVSKKEKTEAQSKMRVGDSEACESNRSSQEDLHSIRNNVVVLLTALLPQLDLAGISMETADVDNILQQIIEVNSLKL